MRIRGALVCVGVSLGVVLSGCGSQGTEDTLPLTVTQSSSVPQPTVTVTVPPSTTTSVSTPSATPAPASTPVSPSTPVAPSAATSAEPPSTSAAPGFDPLALPDLPAPDRDTPGPDAGPACPSNTDYSDESTDGLDGNTAAAYDAAKAAAATVGVTMCLNDGKRSTAQQEATYQGYVDQYGTGAAQTYVLPPEKSEHVAGYAVDVQPAPAYQWLERTAGAFGLCRIYEVEPWHFEFSKAYTAGCPALLPGAVTSY